METRLASAWARLAKEKLGKGPGGISLELCGSVLMVTMHQTLTPLERTLAEAAGCWDAVRDLREVAMQVLSQDFVRILDALGYRAVPVFSEIDVATDRQMLTFRILDFPGVPGDEN
jgi:uncharacterized protein YbcI